MNDVAEATGLTLAISVASVVFATIPALPLAVALGLSRSRAADVALVAARTAMAFPTVLAGLVVYGMVSRHGPLGSLELLYTPSAIVAGEVMLAFPLVVALGASAVRGLDPRFEETLRGLGVTGVRRMLLTVREAGPGVVTAILAAFARCVTELGVALLVGGNLKGSTRTLTTAIALETSRGDFDRAVHLGCVLLAVAVVVNVLLAWSSRGRSAAR
ncbi:MAG: ABC transporter permease [Planctomycetes bacterium]|nr:ABC transporter permease [Planctomycetota bacterium]